MHADAAGTHDRAEATGRAPNAGSRRIPALLLLALGLLAFALRVGALGADPPLLLSRSNAEVVDGPWYLAEAVDRFRGHEVDVPAHYRRPVMTLLALATFEGLGEVSLEAAQVFAALCGALLVIFVALAGWRAFSPRAGLLAGLLLAVGYAPVVMGRVPLVYAPLAAGIALVYWLFAVGLKRRWALWLSAGLLVALAVGLKVHAFLVMPALAVGLFALLPRKRTVALAVGVVAVVAVAGFWLLNPGLVGVTWAKMHGYMGDPTPGEVVLRVLCAPVRSRLLTWAPVLLLLSLVGVLRALGPYCVLRSRGRHPTQRTTARAFEMAAAVGLLTWLGVMGAFAFAQSEGFPPLRHLFPGLVPAALLAGRVLDLLLAGRPVVRACGWLALFPWAFAIAFMALTGLLAGAWYVTDPAAAASGLVAWLGRASEPDARIVTAAVCAGLTAWLLGRRWTTTDPASSPPQASGAEVAPGMTGGRRRLVLPVLCLSVSLGLSAAMVGNLLLRPVYSLLVMNRFVDDVVAPGARLYGNWAHALSYEADVARGLWLPTKEVILRDAHRHTHVVTHVELAQAIGRCFVDEGTPMVPVAELTVRGCAIAMYRFAWAERLGYKPTELEMALGRLRRSGDSGTVPAPARAIDVLPNCDELLKDPWE